MRLWTPVFVCLLFYVFVFRWVNILFPFDPPPKKTVLTFCSKPNLSSSINSLTLHCLHRVVINEFRVLFSTPVFVDESLIHRQGRNTRIVRIADWYLPDMTCGVPLYMLLYNSSVLFAVRRAEEQKLI